MATHLYSGNCPIERGLEFEFDFSAPTIHWMLILDASIFWIQFTTFGLRTRPELCWYNAFAAELSSRQAIKLTFQRFHRCNGYHRLFC